MKSIKKYMIFTLVFGLVLTSTIVYAAFADKGKVLGSSFSVGSADIKLLVDLAGSSSGANLTDELLGPTFVNLAPGWTSEYKMKIFNNATGTLGLVTNANYLTTNDPAELRNIIFVEPFPWNDANNNGTVDTGELGTSLGIKSIVKWKTEGYNLGTFEKGQTLGFVLKFSAPTIAETKQGASALFDFEFESIGQ